MEYLIAAYDRQRAEQILRTWTPIELVEREPALQPAMPPFPIDRQLLVETVLLWRQRALAPMTLRDTLLVDPRRAGPVYDQLCAQLTVANWRGRLGFPLQAGALDAASLPAETIAQTPQLAALLQRAQTEQLALAVWPLDYQGQRYPIPEGLLDLLPPRPRLVRPELPTFQPPTGWRRGLATLMAMIGVLMLLLPMLSGHLPQQPAGWPLLLITGALMLGIRAGWPGWLGALLFWIVPNLPGFHFPQLLPLPALLLLVLGLALLAADAQVRALWRFIYRQVVRS